MTQKYTQEISSINESLMSFKQATLDNFNIEHRYQKAGELREICLSSQHGITINLGNPYNVQQWFEGRYQNNYFSDGNFAIVPSGMTHRVIWDRQIEFIHFKLQASLFSRTALELSDSNHIELIPQNKTSDPLIHQIALALKTEIKSGGLGGKLYVESMMSTLIVHLLRHHCVWAPIVPTYTSGLPIYRLRQVIEYINSNLDEDLSLNKLATIAQISAYHFTRLFKQSMNITVHQYVTNCRIEKAKKLLKQQNLTIIEISQACGFKNQSHFTQSFSKHVSVTPRVYRDNI